MKNKSIYTITENGNLLYKDKNPDLILENPTHLIELENDVVILSAPVICKSETELKCKAKKTAVTGGGVVQDTFYTEDGKTYPIRTLIELKHKDRKFFK